MTSTANAIVVADAPANTFRGKAADLMIAAAKMTLHELVDEFVRLCGVVEENSEDAPAGSYGRQLNEVGEVASRELRVIVAACRARFGLSLQAFDRDMDGCESF